MYILSVDFGTSSVKLSILDETLKLIAKSKIEYNYDVIDKIQAQIDPEIIFAAMIKGIRQFQQDHLDKIEVIVICVFSPALCGMDQYGNSLYPSIIHLDRRSYKQSHEAMDLVGKENFLNINGNLPFSGGISLTSILWIKENYPEIFNRTYKFGHLNTFIHKKLTGEWGIDPSNASFTGLYETLKGGNWSESICNTLGIPTDKLPPIISSTKFIGKLTGECAGLLGLKEGIPVVMGANDTSSAAFGAGAVNHGDILNVAGSSEIVTVTTTDPKPCESYYIRTSVEENKWLYLTITISGFALEWYRKEFYKEISKENFYKEVFEDLLLNYKQTGDEKFDPYLAGDRHSMTIKKGGFSGMTFDTTREDLLMSLLVGTWEPLVNTLRICEEIMDLNKTIFLTGGMTSQTYLNFKKKRFEKYDFNMVEECSTVGNGKIALKAMQE
ncbi:FGGY family carbohydrate kinase [Petroclostridium sp. X23]|uniref:FGGY-family carbohydrate kinase n=1 Tax=Petroclostridium sp. X23 TaxID=3045146 RepID=UPI0024AD8709|nr:FGGY family carbohydrate kinase [Petroclostridium sp. X23]WHH59917.1 FGGY family carbohydrate kinase [Petroclostridium sp. X23]